MDPKTLVVGQDVYMFSGCYVNTGKVAKVTMRGVDVQSDYGKLHFDTEGCSYLTLWDHIKTRLIHGGWIINGTYECGPWYIDDMAFTESKAWLEQGAQTAKKTRNR